MASRAYAPACWDGKPEEGEVMLVMMRLPTGPGKVLYVAYV